MSRNKSKKSGAKPDRPFANFHADSNPPVVDAYPESKQDQRRRRATKRFEAREKSKDKAARKAIKAAKANEVRLDEVHVEEPPSRPPVPYKHNSKMSTAARCQHEYGERNKILRAMGFKDYAEYLKSDLWRRIRARVFIASKECYACGQRATQIHHDRYTMGALKGKHLKHLKPVCGDCHSKLEFKSDTGQKLAPSQAQTKLAHMRHVAQRRAERLASIPVEADAEIPQHIAHLGRFECPPHLIDLFDNHNRSATGLS